MTSNPSGISCGGSCNSTFAVGTKVSLVATPVTGSTFGGWTGACSGSDPNTCFVTLNSDQSVTATFNLAADFSMTPASTSLSVRRGSLVTDALTFAAQGGFAGAISLSCSVSGAAPMPSCSVSPLSVNPGDTATLTVNATALTASGSTSQPFPGVFSAMLLFIATFSLFCSHSLERERRPSWLICALLLGLVLLTGACGGGGNGSGPSPSPPPADGSSSPYVVVVTATSGSLQHSSTINMLVQ